MKRILNICLPKLKVRKIVFKKDVGHSRSMDTFGIYGHDVKGRIQRVVSILDDVFGTLLK